MSQKKGVWIALETKRQIWKMCKAFGTRRNLFAEDSQKIAYRL